MWRDLSDGELRARLVQREHPALSMRHPVLGERPDLEVIDNLVGRRDDEDMAALLDEILGDDG